jgi:hypothetical protein
MDFTSHNLQSQHGNWIALCAGVEDRVKKNDIRPLHSVDTLPANDQDRSTKAGVVRLFAKFIRFCNPCRELEHISSEYPWRLHGTFSNYRQDQFQVDLRTPLALQLNSLRFNTLTIQSKRQNPSDFVRGGMTMSSTCNLVATICVPIEKKLLDSQSNYSPKSGQNWTANNYD